MCFDIVFYLNDPKVKRKYFLKFWDFSLYKCKNATIVVYSLDFDINLIEFLKRSEAQKQWPHELLWMLWFDEKSISNTYSYIFLFLAFCALWSFLEVNNIIYFGLDFAIALVFCGHGYRSNGNGHAIYC